MLYNIKSKMRHKIGLLVLITLHTYLAESVNTRRQNKLPFINKEKAVQYLSRSKRAYKNIDSINHECFTEHCVHEEVKEYCVDGCFEEGRDYCELAPASECVCTYFFRGKCSCSSTQYCITTVKDCSKRSTYHVACIRCPSDFPIENCIHKTVKTCDQAECEQCVDGYYVNADLNCSACPSIANCDSNSVRCSSVSDSYCIKCRDADLYKLYNSGRECADKCSWDNRWCWPGNCGSEYARNCNCEYGFKTIKTSSTAKCEIDETVHKPEIMSCAVKVHGPRGEMRPKSGGSSECSKQKDFYGNFQVSQITTSPEFEFKLSISSQIPAWIVSHMFGITDASVIFIKKAVNGIEQTIKSVSIKSDPQSSYPQNIVSKDIQTHISSTFMNGESFCFRFFANGGGHFVSKNVQNHYTKNVAYNKISISRDLCYHIDTAAPLHCSEKRTCSQKPLVLSNRRIRGLSFTASFSGWFDPIPSGGSSNQASQIEQYEITVFEVSDSSGAYLTVGTKPVNGTQKIVQPNVDSMHLHLPYKDHPVLYAVHLEVKDIADNIKQARRFVLYDNSSTIVFNESVPLLVSSAGSKSEHVWQTNHGKLCFLWKGRYYNNKYIHSNLLKPINAAPHGMINGLYEQNTGLLPVTGTVNIHGITGFMYTLSKGASVIFQNQTVPNFTSQHICLSPTVNDGETFHFQLTAIDIMDNTFDDEIDVHIDASIPEVENVWLVRDGYERLFVHNSTDLSKMILQFDAFDPHSGIFTVKWGIGTTGGGMELGHGSLGVIKHNDSCVSSENCYCPAVGLCEQSNYTLSLNSLVHNNTHIGNHNRQYFFTITVTNMAHLVTVEHLDILVDDSPPVEGVVQEGPIDGPDIDYTSLDQVIVHWHGFIDHESGIKLYRVGIAKNCLTGQQFMDGTKNFTDLFVTETTGQSIIVPLSSEGKHFITVVAYNNAMEPSKPVCSDGIVLDKTSPKIENVSLTNARVAETVACSNNTAWFVHENVTRIKLADVPSCRHRCQGSKFDPLLMSLPEEIIVSRDDEISTFMCNRLARYNNTQIYIPTDTLDLNWDIREDFSQIRNVFVGFGTNLGSKDMPDIVGYQNAKHKRWFRDQHPALSSGTNMYVFIKVMNKAGLTSIATYGPVLIDETPPICPTTIEARVSEQDVILQWNQSTFYDREQREQIGSIFFRIGHMYKFVTPFLQWKINESPNCTDVQGHCILYPVHRLQYYDTELSLPFSFELHVYNYAGHYCSVKSKQFSLPSKFPPGHGVVYDIDPRKATNDKRTTDTDYTTTANKFCVSWTGFWHHKDVTFKVGVGTKKGQDDVVAFNTVHSKTIYCGNSTNLRFLKKYYTTVVAKCSGGTTNATSDGFVIIDKKTFLSSMKVYDGEGCPANAKIFEIMLNSILEPGEDITFNLTETISIGKPYKIKVQPANNNILVRSADFVNLRNCSISEYAGVVMKTQPIIRLSNIGVKSMVEKIEVYSCANDLDFQTSSEIVEIHWTIDAKLENFVTNFKTGVISTCSLNDSSTCATLKTRDVGVSQNALISELNLSPGRYRSFVQACFDDICLEKVESDGFTFDISKTSTGMISATLETIRTTCYEFMVEWERFTCSVIDSQMYPLFYRWAVFGDSSGHTSLTSWKEIISSKNETQKDVECVNLPSYPHSLVFVRVEGFCPFGSSIVASVPVSIKPDPNSYPKYLIYDISVTREFVENIKPSLYSINLGGVLNILHQKELDFATPDVTLGGAIPGIQDRNITWYLTHKPVISNDYCFQDNDCVMSFETTEGLAIFKHVKLEIDRIYYICAKSNSTVIEREFFSEELSEFRTCSDGVYIDNTAPTEGTVKILSMDGYITDASEIIIKWNGFKESVRYLDMGYLSGIRNYFYAIGSYPGGQDVVMFTNAGLSEGIVHRNITLTPGNAYYGTVRAINHVGLQVTSVSQGVIFDNSPPIKGMVHVGGILVHSYVTSKGSLSIHWMNFKDPESGISKFEVGIGSNTYSTDVKALAHVNGDFTLFPKDGMHDGLKYYVTMKVTNGAGLTSMLSSEPFIIDSSPPVAGVVREGTLGSQFDLDYQLDVISLSCHWTDFVDPHSLMLYYRVGLGTSPGETDVFPFYNVALRKDMIWKSHFEPGKRYYVTVEGCNGAGLCTRASSNGIIMDNSPPITGLVHVGVTGMHEKYISQTSTLQAQWIGFQDPQSEIHHFEACVGTNSKLCDIFPFTNFLLSSSLTLTQLQMPIGKKLFVILRAYNHVGLYSDKSSDSFVIDTTAPIINEPPRFDLDNNLSHKNNTQWEVSMLKIKWNVKDKESPVVRQTVSLMTHHDGNAAVEEVSLASEEHLTITLDSKNWLKNGDRYHVELTSCNSASLCTSVSSNDLLIDSSPPHLGGFELPLTWSSSTKTLVHLKWYGFVDVESDINVYYVTVGNTYSGSELTGGPIVFSHIGKNDEHQERDVNLLEKLSVGQKVFLSIWAENKAGLLSKIGKITTEVVATDNLHTEGKLMIEKHSCDVHYCNKDCTCAVIGRKCANVIYKNPCTEYTETSVLPIKLVVGYHSKHQNSTASSACLSSNWRLLGGNKTNVLRYEWSFGVDKMAVGAGIFDLTYENVWYDIGNRTHIVHCLPPGRNLTHDDFYVAYLRAWVSSSEYFTYKSEPIKIDLTAPSVRRGRFIKDSDRTCSEDIDYTNITDTMTACWGGVFSEQQTRIISYHVSMGTQPGADDVIPFTAMGLQTSITWNNLFLKSGTKYYTTVKVTNEVDLQFTLSSDGFIVDNKNPYNGVVFNTKFHKNTHVQSSNTSFGVSWHGFEDSESHIRSYQVALFSKNESFDNINVPFIDVGIANSIKLEHIELSHGEMYIAAVKALDAAGFESNVSFSDPLLIDTTPPLPFICTSYNVSKSEVLTIIGDTTHAWNDTLEFKINVAYKLKLHIENVNMDVMATFNAEQFSVSLPLSENADGSFTTIFDFISPFDGDVPASVTINGADNKARSRLEFSVCAKISTERAVKSTAIMVRQISPYKVSLCVNAFDDESEITHVLVGAGTTPGGFQVRSLLPSSLTSHMVMDVNVTHGTPLYITAVVENSAKLRESFYSQKIIIDHTNPIITDYKLSVSYNSTMLDSSDNSSIENTTSTLELHWHVSDPESDIKLCFCALGKSVSSTNLQTWTEVTLDGKFVFDPLTIHHGQDVHAMIKCINNVELATIVHVNPVIIIYQQPDVGDAKVSLQAVPPECGSKPNVQSNDSSVELLWEGFIDLAGITSYQCRIREENKTIVDWVDMNMRTGAKLSGLNLKDGQEYITEVRASNVGYFQSEPVNNSVVIRTMPPRLRGNRITTTKITESKLTLQWNDVFDLDDSLFSHFTITVGSAQGNCDLLRQMSLQVKQFTLNVEPSTQEIYVSLTAFYCTGKYTTTRQTLKI